MATLFDTSHLEWAHWEQRICCLIGLDAHSNLSSGSLPRPWFLLPTTTEIGESEANELFAAIRHQIWGEVARPSFQRAERFLQSLSPRQSLPFLYAMRYVAQQSGKRGRYWPEFRRAVFANCLDLSEIHRLAPILALAWERLHRHSAGALFRPAFGRPYIKWPLAHAGILPQDELVLRSFGRFLHQAYEGSASASALSLDDLEEFRLSFLDWYMGQRRFSQSSLATLLEKHQDGTDIVIAEVAQRWLREHWDDLAMAEDVVSVPRLPRRALRYAVAQNELRLILGETSWPGRVPVTFFWGERQEQVAIRYAKTANRTYCNQAEFPISLSDPGPNTAEWRVGQHIYPLRLPSLPDKDRSLVFDSQSGKSLTQWQMGENYYILLRRVLVIPALADRIFETWTDLGAPEFAGTEFALLWVRSRDFLGSDRLVSRTDDALKMAEDMDAATQELFLPSFSHLWEPRFSMVGGFRLPTIIEEAYDLNEALPWLEIRGLYSSFSVTLARWDEITAQFVDISSCQLPASSEAQNPLLELSPYDKLTEGLYQVSGGAAEPLTFRIRPASSSTWRPARPLCVQLAVETIHRNSEGGDCSPLVPEWPSRLDLLDGFLIAQGWPHAELTLSIRFNTRDLEIRVSLGSDGLWRARWRDLGIRLDQPGLILLTLSWRGVAVSEVTVSDMPYVESGALTVIADEAKHCLTIAGKISNIENGELVDLIVLARRFWAGKGIVKPLYLSENGEFEVTIRLKPQAVCWLALMPHTDSTTSVASKSKTGVWHLQELREPKKAINYPLTNFIPSTESSFPPHSLIRSLDVTMLPLRLRDELILGHLSAFMIKHKIIGPRGITLHPRWHPLRSTADWSSFAAWLQTTLPVPPLVLFDGTEMRSVFSPSKRAALLKPYLTITDIHLLAQILETGEGKVSLTRAEVNHLTWLPATTRFSRTDTEWQTEVVGDRVFLYHCSQCGLILDADAFNRHSPPARGLAPCHDFSSQPPGKGRFAQFALLIQPIATWRWMRSVLLDAINGNDVPDRAVVWLEQLGEVYPDTTVGEDLGVWIRQLTQIMVSLLRVIEKTRISERAMVRLAAHVRRQERALDVLFEWLNSEMNWQVAG